MKRPLAVVAALVITAACGRGSTTPETPLPPEPASEVRKPASLPARLNVITLGDSLAYGTGDEKGGGIARRLDAELERRGVADAEIVNLGINGAQTSDLIARLRQERVQKAVRAADAVVLSIGANDLFRSPGAREETLRAPLQVADRILSRLEEIVGMIRDLNADAHILILGGYNPVPGHPFASMINDYLRLWDSTLAERFGRDRRIAVVRMSDIVNQQRLSRHDNFHPGGDAYEEAAKRIAAMLLEEVRS